MLRLLHRLMADGDGAAGGGAAGTAAPPAGGGGAPAGSGAAAGGGAAPAPYDWKTNGGFSDEQLPVIQNFGWKSPTDMFTSYRNLEKAVGVPPERLIKLPDPKSTDPNAWNEVYAKLGRPETPDKYAITVPEGQPKEFATEAAKWFHEAGMPQSMVTKITEKWNAHVKAGMDKATAERNQRDQVQNTELKTAWGADYDKNADLVDRVGVEFGMKPEHFKAFKDALGPKAAMELFLNIGKKLGSEDTTVPGVGEKGQGAGGMTPEQAKAKIAEYTKFGSDFAKLFSSSDPKTRMEARAEMDRLQKIAYPGHSAVANLALPK